jgi:hypothetical protein
MVTLEAHRRIRAFHLLMGIYNDGWPKPEPRKFLPKESPKPGEPPRIIEEFTINTTTGEITPSGPIPKKLP